MITVNGYWLSIAVDQCMFNKSLINSITPTIKGDIGRAYITSLIWRRGRNYKTVWAN